MTLTPTLTIKGDGVPELAGFTESRTGPAITIPGGIIGGLIGSLLKGKTGKATVTVTVTESELTEKIAITENLPLVGGSLSLADFSEAINPDEYFLLTEFIPNGSVELEADLTLI